MSSHYKEHESLGRRILSLSRSELYLSMRYLDLALSALSYDFSLQTRSLGTDGIHLFFNTAYLGNRYAEDPIWVNRAYLHSILHCIFHHVTGCQERDKDDWDLACDMAVESIIDSLQYPCVHCLVRDRRQAYYDSMDVSVFNAEQIYMKLRSMPDQQRFHMRAEFQVDDHAFWLRDSDDDQDKDSSDSGDQDTLPPDKDEVENKWQDISQKTKVSMETFNQRADLSGGDLLKQLRIENRKRVDYKDFLAKFSAFREEVAIDPDSFDYAFYSYGLKLYKNMPLIEELEYRESKKIHDFVIAVDTSGSCTGELLQLFLEQTAAILLDNNSFFKKINLHIIQCDAIIQSDIKITDIRQMKKLSEAFSVRGDGDTDFRPVFSYVDGLIASGELTQLKGIIFFTDGIGVFPRKRPAYDTAFIFLDDEYTEHTVPPWAIRLVLGREDLK